MPLNGLVFVTGSQAMLLHCQHILTCMTICAYGSQMPVHGSNHGVLSCMQLECLGYEPMVVISKADMIDNTGGFVLDTLGKHTELEKVKAMVTHRPPGCRYSVLLHLHLPCTT